MLAEAYVAAGRYADAVGMYQSCLKGIYADDPPFVLGLAFAQFLNQTYPEAKETIERLAQVDVKFRPLERRLLLARTLEAMNETEAALEEYEPLAKQYPGEEAKCRYALLLKNTGQTEKAREVFEEDSTKRQAVAQILPQGATPLDQRGPAERGAVSREQRM